MKLMTEKNLGHNIEGAGHILPDFKTYFIDYIKLNANCFALKNEQVSYIM